MPAAQPLDWLVITFIDLFVLFHSSLSVMAGAGALQNLSRVWQSVFTPLVEGAAKNTPHSGSGGGEGDGLIFLLKGNFWGNSLLGGRVVGGETDRRQTLLLSDGAVSSPWWPGWATAPPSFRPPGVLFP